MADGAFCDYQQQMESMLPHLTNYGGRSAPDHIDGDSHNKGSAGFYLEQFPAGMPVTMMESLGLTTSTANLNGHNGIAEAMASTMMNQAAMFESAMNYALKQEKALPPTPPGSPDEPKDTRSHQSSSSQSNYHSSMHPASMVALQSSINPNILAKPVPMRRMSDKTASPNPRTNLGTQSSPPSSTSSSTAAATSQDLPMPLGPPPDSGGGSSPALARALAAVQQTQKRPRSEKKPIPDEQKDTKYFERRKRNNSAAKKSRDARKAREDEIAIRASFLEKENAILRAQVTTLREEANSLRQLLLQKRSRH